MFTKLGHYEVAFNAQKGRIAEKGRENASLEKLQRISIIFNNYS